MKLLELHGHHQYASQSLSVILSKFIEEKKLHIEQGSFAFVIIPRNSDYIYKCWTNDPAYEEYLEFIKKNKSSPYVPKLIRDTRKIPVFFKHETKSVKLKVQRMEKLERISPDSILYKALNEIFITMRMFHRSTRVESDTIIKRAIANSEETDLVHKRIKELEPFVEFMIKVKLSAKGFGDDLVRKNVLVRGDIPVIIDPFSDTAKTYTTAADMLQDEPNDD